MPRWVQPAPFWRHVPADEPKFGRPVEVDVDELRSLVESDPRQTTREYAARLGSTHSTIEQPLHVHEMGKVQKLG